MRVVVPGGTGTIGRHVVRLLAESGHDAVPLSRRTGSDVEAGVGLTEALQGADAVIDATSTVTASRRRAVRFFSAVTRNLLAAEARAGVGQHVAVSIVGIDRIDAGYYGGKLAQERLIETGDRPYSLLRVAQFHEFAGQVLARGRIGRLAIVPAALIRPIAAAEVASALVAAVEAGPQGRLRDLVGPRDERLADLVRRLVRADDLGLQVIEVSPPGRFWRGTRSGVLRGGPDAHPGAIGFDEWLEERAATAVPG